MAAPHRRPDVYLVRVEVFFDQSQKQRFIAPVQA
jgi:hypothetical protein